MTQVPLSSESNRLLPQGPAVQKDGQSPRTQEAFAQAGRLAGTIPFEQSLSSWHME